MSHSQLAQRTVRKDTAAYASLSHDSLVKEPHRTRCPKDNKKPAPGQIPVQIPSQTLGKYQNSANPPTKAVNAVNDPDIRPPDPPSTPHNAIFSTLPKPKRSPKPQDHDNTRRRADQSRSNQKNRGGAPSPHVAKPDLSVQAAGPRDAADQAARRRSRSPWRGTKTTCRCQWHQFDVSDVGAPQHTASPESSTGMMNRHCLERASMSLI